MSAVGVEADVVICGAGIAGIAAAYFLSSSAGMGKVLLIDERPPLSLTSDKSTEAYRNWWPGPDDTMVRFMDRSIDLMEALALETGNRFHLNRRGYIYVTADPEYVPVLQREAAEIAQLGAGPLREREVYEPPPAHGYANQPRGADLYLDEAAIRRSFPFLNENVQAILHARRCGWLSAQQLGMTLLDKARERGVELLSGKVVDVALQKDQVRGVTARTDNGDVTIKTSVFVNAAGPYLRQVGALTGVDLPVYNELHGKIAFEDELGIIPRDLPMMIWNDPVSLPWSAEEEEDLAAFEDTAWMLDPLPPGLHFRPEGGPGSKTVLFLWPYHISKLDEPVWPLQFDEAYVEIVLRGMMRMVPGLSVYLDRMRPPYVDGGYYSKTRENRPLIGPLPVEGAYVIGGLSGYGVMAAMAAGELLAAHVCGQELPAYAPFFELRRYEDAAYQALLRSLDATTGQL